MRKIPVPVMVGIVVVALAILGYVVYSGIARPAGDSGDVKAITSDIIKNNPKDAPELPADQLPSAMAVSPGKGKKMQSR